MTGMLGPEALGNEYFNRLAEKFFARIAKQFFCLRIALVRLLPMKPFAPRMRTFNGMG